MSAYYNDIEPFCCGVLRARIADGRLPAGTVDGRDIRLVRPDELAGYKQVHLFAGLGGFAYACRLAGWPDDRELWTAGVPCQPASNAGKRKGSADDRWLWPDFLRLVRGCKPVRVLAENVPGLVGLKPHGLDWVQEQMEDAGYRCVSVVVGARHVGAPHKRDRVWIACELADGASQRDRGVSAGQRPERKGETHANRAGQGMADATGRGRGADGSTPQGSDAGHADLGGAELADGVPPGLGASWVTQRQSPDADKGGKDLANTGIEGLPQRREQPAREECTALERGGCAQWPARPGEPQYEWEEPRLLAYPKGGTAGRGEQQPQDGHGGGHRDGSDDTEPQQQVGPPAYELPERLVRHITGITGWPDTRAQTWAHKNKVRIERLGNKLGLKAAGNAICPSVAAAVLRAWMECEL